MKSVDIIVKYIEENRLSQNQVAQMVGMSRQNLWDKLNKGNPRFNSLERIMSAFGFEIRIRRADGSDPEFDEEGVLQELRETNLCVDSIESVIKSMGYVLEYEKKSGTP